MCQNTTCDIKESNSYVHNFKKQEWKQSIVLEFFFIFSINNSYFGTSPRQDPANQERAPHAFEKIEKFFELPLPRKNSQWSI